MCLFARVRGTREIDRDEPPRPRRPSGPPPKHRSRRSNRRLPDESHIPDIDPDRPVNGSRNPPPRPPIPRPDFEFQDPSPFQVLHRDASDLSREACYDISPETMTNYPCTRKQLKASGGIHRQTAGDAYGLRDKTKWFAYPNNGPFLDSRIAAREVYDYNDPTRATSPSAGEEGAISRLMAGIQNAGREFWGPDLAIKAFCDLDKVFFRGKLKGHVCLTWKPHSSFAPNCFGSTYFLGEGKCVIALNPYTNFFAPLVGGSGFVQMFATLLHEMCHAYLQVRAIRLGPTGWSTGLPGGHGLNFGTMIYAVNRRARELFGLQGDSLPYPRHDYANDDQPRPTPEQRPTYIPPPRNLSRPAASTKSRRDIYNDAFQDVTLDSGTDYYCTQSDLDATGGSARREFPKDDHRDRKASRRKWFAQPNHGPFVSPRRACLDTYNHNNLHRKPGNLETEAIERLSAALVAGCHGSWGPDLIIKAFCDLDVVFFRGRLRGHVCVRWLPDWSETGETIWGATVFLGKGKCAIRMNADTILLEHCYPFQRMVATMLHEMCHADAQTQVQEEEMLKCASHGRNFGTRYYAVEKRAKKLFGIPSLKGYRDEVFPRHEYEKGDGFP